MPPKKQCKQAETILSKYGEFSPQECRLFDFPGSIFGFAGYKEWYLIISEKDKYFCYLQSAEDIDAGLILLHKDLCYPDYPLEFYEENLGLLMLESTQTLSDCAVFFVANIPQDMANITLNLQGPIVINPKSNRGIQAISIHSEEKLDYKKNLQQLLKEKLPNQE